MNNSQRLRNIPVLAKCATLWVAAYLFFKFVITPPLPQSLILMYMILTTVGVMVYITLYEDLMRDFFSPIAGFLKGGQEEKAVRRYGRWGVLLFIPLWVGGGVYARVIPSDQPPLEQRVVHPAPPPEITGFYNPLREEKENYERNVKDGAAVFYSNCVFCHGDKLDGKGHFAHGFNPLPANFVDSGTIAQLQESYVFWRVSKGGPGLPEESAPWNSAMPRWETMLTEEERWKVILFLYDYTGHSPRTWE